MDEKDVAKIVVEAALRPLTTVVDNAVGLFGGDALAARRQENRERLAEKIKKRMKHTSADLREPSPRVAIPLLEAAQEESSDELLNVWSALFVSAMSAEGGYRQEFINIVKQLDPQDVRTFLSVTGTPNIERTEPGVVARVAKLTADQVTLSFKNLARLELTERHPDQMTHPYLSVSGRELRRIVDPPKDANTASL